MQLRVLLAVKVAVTVWAVLMVAVQVAALLLRAPQTRHATQASRGGTNGRSRPNSEVYSGR